MPAYDANHFNPPAPVAQVTLRHPESKGLSSDVLMLIDTGADATVIPRGVLTKLQLTPQEDKQYELQGFDGNLSYASVVRLELRWLGRTFRGQFLVIEGDVGVIGRNVLNSLRLVLDGPYQSWDVLNTG